MTTSTPAPMSAVGPPTTTLDRLPDPSGVQRFSTLLHVEVRKMTDTRSSRSLLALMFCVSALVLTWAITHREIPTTFGRYSDSVAGVIVFIVPVIGLLAMTSEWTQRTALTTFTMSPRRLRVISAKYIAALVVSASVMMVGIVLAFAGTAIGGIVHGHATYSGIPGSVRSDLLVVLLQVTMAAALGALIGQTTAALGAFVAAPVVFSAVAQQLLGGLAPWFDVFSAYGQLWSNHPLQHIGPTLTSITGWIVVPAAIGVARALRREVK